jgi:hypothetical protein
MARITLIIKFYLFFRCKSLKGPNISNLAIILFKCLDWKTTFTRSYPSRISMMPPLYMTCKLLVLAYFTITSFFLSHMNKCYYGVMTFWCCFTGSRLDWSPNSSRHLCSYYINTLGSPINLGSSIGFSTSLSTNELGLTTPNVNDGVCCLFCRYYVLGESKASPNIDISVLFKTLILKIKKLFLLFLLKNLQHF